jgi:hypothetical protein
MWEETGKDKGPMAVEKPLGPDSLILFPFSSIPQYQLGLRKKGNVGIPK